MDRLADYQYNLPPELIAEKPAARREEARMLVLHRESGRLEHRRVSDLPEYLNAGDALVLNDTRVLPARLFGTRTQTGGRWEGLFLSFPEEGLWRLMSQTKGKLQPGETVTIRKAHSPDDPETFRLTMLSKDPDGLWLAKPESGETYLDLLQTFGTMPLPPYIKKELPSAADWQRYQTTFAARPGSVAAPTAGLHFTPELLSACASRDVSVEKVTLHVGIGTFRPIATENLSEHKMHSEWCELSVQTASRLKQTKDAGGRVVAVGTTSVRTLESAAKDGTVGPFSGETDLFIRPPYNFRAVDALLTNFHLPGSSLLVLVSALAGRDLIQKAYTTAIEQRYRFFSYGDAMLIL